MRVFTKINGKLACWDVDDGMTYEVAIRAVRDEVGLKHRGAILALVKH
jgi:hypothetical protein